MADKKPLLVLPIIIIILLSISAQWSSSGGIDADTWAETTIASTPTHNINNIIEPKNLIPTMEPYLYNL